MPTLAEAVWIARSRGWIPHLSAGVCGGSKALSYIGLAQAAAPPPVNGTPAALRLGFFFDSLNQALARLDGPVGRAWDQPCATSHWRGDIPMRWRNARESEGAPANPSSAATTLSGSPARSLVPARARRQSVR